MPDGQTHGDEDFDVIDQDALDHAIRTLEQGAPVPDVGIDLGGGCFARADGSLGKEGLLQRLKGHRQMLQIARNRTVLGSGMTSLTVDGSVKSLLDAVRKAG
ncbi:MAG: hypothetical protein AAGJ32_00600 [Pseudomonadota bacterium]